MRTRITSLSASSCSSTSSSLSSKSIYCSKRNPTKNRYQILPYHQIQKLLDVLDQNLLLASSIPGLPTVQVKLKQFLDQICKNLNASDVIIEDIRLNGGAASYVIGSTTDPSSYSDLDLIISLDNSTNQSDNPDNTRKIRNAILNSILKTSSKLQQHQNRLIAASQNNQAVNMIPESYIQKQVRINDGSNGDSWSLISLGSNYGDSRIVELKLVYTMKRKFEFSVDSFQIKLDSILTFLDRECEMTSHFYPTVVAESVWGSFQEARQHLEEKIIMTEKPEEIRGGGLLKYCKLIVEGYQPYCDLDVLALERYMCSRFFIDFPDLEKQKHKLLSYLINHFPDNCDIRMRYLQTLEQVVSHSTVCLMNHERYQTLSLISGLKYDVWNRAQTPLHIDLFDDPDIWVLDHVFYGTATLCSPQTVTPTPPSILPCPVTGEGCTKQCGNSKYYKKYGYGISKCGPRTAGNRNHYNKFMNNNNDNNNNKPNINNNLTKTTASTNQISPDYPTTNQNSNPPPSIIIATT